jgi:hypothetical protein
MHLVDVLRAEGEPISWNSKFADWWASALWFVRLAMNGIPAHISTAADTAARRIEMGSIHMFAALDPKEKWHLAQFALDLFGTHLAQTSPFYAMHLDAPTDFEGTILLRLQVGAPVAPDLQL